jgi:hypothetical protein
MKEVRTASETRAASSAVDLFSLRQTASCKKSTATSPTGTAAEPEFPAVQ